MDSDITRAARFMIDRHGPRAAGRAALRAEQLSEEGCDRAASLWRDIEASIGALSGSARALPRT